MYFQKLANNAKKGHYLQVIIFS